MPLEELVAIFITLGLLFLMGLTIDLLGKFIRLPRVSLLLLFGFAIGPSGLGFLADTDALWIDAVSTIALVMVGFLLGERLTLTSLQEQGRLVLSVSLLVTVGTVLLVFAGLIMIGVDWPLAILLAAMATATDPAATTDVIHESGAKGPFTNALLGIVAIDDLWGLLTFSLVLTIVATLTQAGGGLDAMTHGLWDLGAASAIGLVLGVPMALLSGRLRPGEPSQTEALGFVFLCAGLAMWLEVSFILAAIVLGMTVANMASHHRYAFNEIEGIEWPFLLLFFVLAGASLDIHVVQTGGSLLVVYVVYRIIGRLAGGWLGTVLARGPVRQRRWYGMALLPQAGVAVGMALIGAQRFPEYADQLLSIAVAATIIFELLGPISTRMAITAQGENKEAKKGASR